MSPEERRRRAGAAVTERMDELGLTAPQLAEKAGVHPATVRALINGKRTLHMENTERIVAALDWPPGELARRVWGAHTTLTEASTEDLVRELCRRLAGDQHAS